jgi:hypothetical protein
VRQDVLRSTETYAADVSQRLFDRCGLEFVFGLGRFSLSKSISAALRFNVKGSIARSPYYLALLTALFTLSKDSLQPAGAPLARKD